MQKNWNYSTPHTASLGRLGNIVHAAGRNIILKKNTVKLKPHLHIHAAIMKMHLAHVLLTHKHGLLSVSFVIVIFFFISGVLESCFVLLNFTGPPK